MPCLQVRRSTNLPANRAHITHIFFKLCGLVLWHLILGEDMIVLYDVLQIVMCKYHTVLLTTSGSVFTCGHGFGGRLGHPTEETCLVITIYCDWQVMAVEQFHVGIQLSSFILYYRKFKLEIVVFEKFLESQLFFDTILSIFISYLLSLIEEIQFCDLQLLAIL
mgnify:CR=1 FL=1